MSEHTSGPMRPDPDSEDALAAGLRAALSGDSVRRLIQDLGSPAQVDLPAHNGPAEESPVVTGDGEAVRASLPPGDFHILGEIARGGMGVILRAHETDLRRDVAIKVLQKRFAKEPEVLRRFVEEAQIGGQLQHPGIVPVYDLGMLADERPYFCMKLIKGETLAAQLKARDLRDPADRRRLLDVLLAVCQTMAYAHSRGVIHRDLKPSNVMVGSFGEVQVVDWGLAKVLPRGGVHDEGKVSSDERLLSVIRTVRSGPGSEGTASLDGAVLGTPSFMPPEQARGSVDRLDCRSDVFALGAILCEILTGVPPYGTDMSEVIRRAAQADLHEAEQRLRACGAHTELVELCLQCLAPAQEARPANAGELTNRLQAHLDGIEKRARQSEVDAAAAAAKAVEERKARRLTTALAAVVLLSMLLGGGGYWSVRHQRDVERQHDIAQVNQALADTALLEGQQRWAEAAAAAERASALVPDGAPQDLAARVEATRTRLVAVAEQQRNAEQLAVDNARLLAELGRAAEPAGGSYYRPDWQRLDRGFADIFAAAGLDPESKDPAVSAAVTARGIPVEIAQSLVEWSSVRRNGDDVAGADKLLRAAIRLDPDPSRVAMRTAVLERDPDALRHILAGLDPATTPTADLIEAGRAAQAMQLTDVALEVQLAAANRRPGDALVLHEVGKLLDKARRHDESIRYLQGALALKPDNLGLRRDMSSALMSAQAPEAVQEAFLREALRRWPDDAYLNLRLGFLLALGNRNFGDESDRPMPAYRQRATPRLEEALERLRRAVASNPHPDYFVNLANTYNSLGYWEEGLQAARDGLAQTEQESSSPAMTASLWVHCGTALYNLGRRDEQLEAYRNALAVDPESRIALASLAQTEAGEGNDASLDALRRAVEEHPDVRLLRASLCQCLMVLGRFDEALSVVEKFCADAPDYCIAWCMRGNLLQAMGRIDDAIAALEQGLVATDGASEVHDALTVVQIAARRFDELRARALRELDAGNDHHVFHFALGIADLQQGRFESAEGHLVRALTISGPNPNLQINRARAVLLGKDRERGLALVDELVRDWPRFFGGYLMRSNVRITKGDIDGALDDACKAVEYSRRAMNTLDHCATLLIGRGHIEEGYAMLRELVDRLDDPRPVGKQEYDPAARAYLIGTTLMQGGDARRAERMFSIQLARTPEMAEAWCNLARVLEQQQRDFEALECMARGDELGRKRAEWRYPSGQWLAGMRSAVETRAGYTAMAADGAPPADPEEAFAFGEWLSARGSFAEAARMFDAAMAVQRLSPDQALRTVVNAVQWIASGALDGDPTRSRALLARCLPILQARRDENAAEAGVSRSGPNQQFVQLATPLADERLAPLRDDPTFGGRDTAEQAAWQDYWDGLRKLVKERAAAGQ